MMRHDVPFTTCERCLVSHTWTGTSSLGDETHIPTQGNRLPQNYWLYRDPSSSTRYPLIIYGDETAKLSFIPDHPPGGGAGGTHIYIQYRYITGPSKSPSYYDMQGEKYLLLPISSTALPFYIDLLPEAAS